MSNDSDEKLILAASTAPADTAMERKFLALKKAVKVLFAPTNPRHISVDHYNLHPTSFFGKMFKDDYSSIIDAIKSKVHGLSQAGIESQTPTIDKLGYQQSLLEIIDGKQQTKHNNVKQSIKPQPAKTEQSHSMWETFLKGDKLILDKVENLINSEFNSHDSVVSQVPHNIKPKQVKEK